MKKSMKAIITGLFLVALTPAASKAATWEEIEASAVKNSREYIAAGEQLKQANASFFSAFSAVLPSVSGSLGASKSGGDSSGIYSTGESYSYGIRASMLLFDGFATYNQIGRAAYDNEASYQTFRQTSASIRNKLRTAFVDAVKSAELVDMTGSIMERRKKQRDEVELRYEAGREHKGSLLSAGANYSQAVFEHEQAKRNNIMMLLELSRISGIDAGTLKTVTGTLENAVDITTEPDFNALVKAAPYYRIYRAKKESAGRAAAAAYGAFAPDISISASAGKSGSRWAPDNNSYSLGLSLSIPIFEGGKNIAATVSASSAYAKASAEEEDALKISEIELRTKWNSLQDAVAQVGIRKQYLEAAEERAKIADAQYSTGLINFNNWTIIQDDLVSSKKSYLESKATLQKAESAWASAKGDGLNEK
ncbi:MAG: TolC family protein [Spirochaetia bacterium]|nr:TolC family protein [Spirochaetia bacterium]